MEFRVFSAIGIAFKSWFRNFIPFTLLTGVLYAPVIWWLATFNASSVDDGETIVILMLAVLGIVASLVAPLLTYRVIQELSGNKVSMLTSMKYGMRGFLAVLVAGIITGIVGQLTIVGSMVSIVLDCVWWVVGPAAVAEKVGPFVAMSRSAELTRGRRWGIFALILMLGAVKWGFVIALFVPMLSGHDAALEGWRSTLIIAVVVFGVCLMFKGIVEAVSYALLRNDKDGLSHEQLATVFE